MQLLIAVAMSQIGTPYLFGGKHPSTGLDCSGFISFILASAGVVSPFHDLNAQGIFDQLSKAPGTQIGVYKAGALVFYGKDIKSIDHVAFMLDQVRIIESGGGDATFVSVDPAQQAAHHAGVRVRLLKYRQDFVQTIFPSYASIGLI